MKDTNIDQDKINENSEIIKVLKKLRFSMLFVIAAFIYSWGSGFSGGEKIYIFTSLAIIIYSLVVVCISGYYTYKSYNEKNKSIIKLSLSTLIMFLIVSISCILYTNFSLTSS